MIDRSRPYEEIIGIGYRYLVQHGRKYTMAGAPMDQAPPKPVEEVQEVAEDIVSEVRGEAGPEPVEVPTHPKAGLVCTHCGLEAKSPAGLAAHIRSKHGG